MVNIYLVLAYSFVWGIFMFYAWIILNREKSLQQEVEQLKSEFGQQGGKNLKSQT